MTMDISNRRTEVKPKEQVIINTDEKLSAAKTIKRPFDVAFLMLPDEKLKKRQLKAAISEQKLATYESNDKNETDEETELGSNPDSPKAFDLQRAKIQAKYFQVPIKQQIFGDPKPRIEYENGNFSTAVSVNIPPEQKSAFTKVKLLSKDVRMSPNLSISPDLSYQNSLSPSPPISNRNYQHFTTNMLSPNQIFKAHNIPSYHSSFIHENLNNFTASCPTTMENPFLSKPSNSDLMTSNFAKIRPILGHYRPDISYNYSPFQPQEMLKMAQPDLKFPPEIRNPAAAILTTLLPPSFAALSLPAQNVCAKCNISFRMTSDLVYHMRSHHKNDSVDVCKKKREDKLKCPVCAESFRERHHLTRHMTAHQDKEADEEPDLKKKSFVNFAK